MCQGRANGHITRRGLFGPALDCSIYRIEQGIITQIISFMVLLGSNCIVQQPPSCPEQTNIEGNKCVSFVSPSCDQSAKWDGKRCVVSGHASCENGIHKGDDCITGTPPSCPDGSAFDGARCVSISTPQCRQGTYVVYILISGMY